MARRLRWFAGIETRIGSKSSACEICMAKTRSLFRVSLFVYPNLFLEADRENRPQGTFILQTFMTKLIIIALKS